MLKDIEQGITEISISEQIRQEIPLLDQLLEDCAERFKSKKTKFIVEDGKRKIKPYTLNDAAMESITMRIHYGSSPFELFTSFGINPEGVEIIDAIYDAGPPEPKEPWSDYVARVSSFILAGEARYAYPELFEEETSRLERWDPDFL